MERFFGNIGGKLKKFAFVIAIIGIVFSVIGGVAIWIGGEGFFYTGRRYGDGYCFLSGLLVLVVGSLASYMGSWMLYAFGTLVENTQRIADKLTGTSVTVPSSADSTESAAPLYTWKCPSCRAENPAHKGVCPKCGASKPINR